MKIALIYPVNPAGKFGGLEHFGKKFSQELAKKNHSVEVFTSKRKEAVRIPGVQVREFSTIHFQNAYFFPPGLLEGIRHCQADILNCQGYNNFFTLLAIMGKKPSQKLVLTLHNSGSSSRLRKAFLPLFDSLVNQFSQKIDLVVCTSQFELEEFLSRLKVPREKFCTVKRGMDIELLKNLKVTKKKQLIVSVARLVEDKGIYQLIQGFSVLLKKVPNASLRIIGDGPEMKRLKRTVSKLGISPRVEFAGTIPIDNREEYVRSLKEAEAVALLGSPHTDSLVVLEGIAAGMRVVIPSQGVLGEYATAKQAIGVDDINNPAEVAEKLEMALAKKSPEPDPHFVPSWSQFADQMIQLYEKLLTNKNGKT